MLNFPDWSDLGDLSPQTRNSWEGEAVIREKYYRYFSGLIFEDEVPIEAGVDEEAPELYPVGINLVKMLCIAQADSEFGEWDDEVVTFEPDQDEPVGEPEERASALARQILTNSNANSMLWEVCLERNVYGGAPIEISFDLHKPGFIKWSRVPLSTFFPIWDPEDPENLLEVYVVVPMTQEQARAKYGYDNPSKDIIYLVKHWTQGYYESKLDDKRIDAYSGINPWGFVPFVYIPRLRSTHWWGDALTEDVIRVQDELNMRVADLGEAINYNAHPIKWGLNMPRDFNTQNFPIGPNFLWDLGRAIGNSPEPKVGILEAKNPIPQGTFDYINFLYDWSRTSVFAPPIAFGEDNGGGQRSGVTLEIRMWPLIKAVKRSRSYLASGLQRALWMSAQIIKQKKLEERVGGVRALQRIIDGALKPHFSPIMPRDQAKIVDEVVKRFTTTPPSISLETAVKKLGDGVSEVAKIEKMLENDAYYKRSAVGMFPPEADDATGGTGEKDEGEAAG